MIRVINEKKEKDAAIRVCDSAFPHPVSSRNNYDELLDKIDRNAEFIADYQNDEIAGYAAMYNNDLASKTAYITMIGVREKYQRQHIGGQLINWCKESALKRGMKRIRLEVLDSNEKAIRFYEKEGFIFEKKCSENSRYMIFEITAAL